jgi:23S rRNA pseudouridine1911/1915/1917 synthase
MEKLFEIIHEDDELLVVNKPADLVCHPTKNGEMSSLIGRVRLHLQIGLSAHAPETPVRSSILHPPSSFCQPHLVNRLDRETSGVVIVAKSSVVAGELGKILESRTIEKEYLAIIHGHVEAEQGIIDAPLGKDELSVVAIKDCVRPDGASSQTEFRVERRFVRELPQPATTLPPPSAFTLVRLRPLTGRKHQLRIHLAHLGHPIVGDKLYGGDEDLYLALVEQRLTEPQRARLIFENHALHAVAVRFAWRGQPREFTCVPESWFSDFVDESELLYDQIK